MITTRILAMSAALLGLAGAPDAQPFAPPGYGPPPPPPGYYEAQPPRPAFPAEWAPAHYRWTPAGYRWEPGHWISGRRGHFVPGHWSPRGWIPEHWAR